MFVVAVFAFLATACTGNSNGVEIEGRLLNMNQADFFLYSPDGAIPTIDTIHVMGGRFVYENTNVKEGTLVIVFPNFKTIPVFVSPGASIDIKGDAEYKIEKDYFNTALFCLVDNAAKYGNNGAKIEATVTSKAITIRNKTAAGNYTPGTGIAIAGRIMEQHKLKLTTDLKDGIFEAKISTK